jgi:hypothetical protein
MVDDFWDVTGLNGHENLQRQPSFYINHLPDHRQTRPHQDITLVTTPSHHISPRMDKA